MDALPVHNHMSHDLKRDSFESENLCHVLFRVVRAHYNFVKDRILLQQLLCSLVFLIAFIQEVELTSAIQRDMIRPKIPAERMAVKATIATVMGIKVVDANVVVPQAKHPTLKNFVSTRKKVIVTALGSE